MILDMDVMLEPIRKSGECIAQALDRALDLLSTRMANMDNKLTVEAARRIRRSTSACPSLALFMTRIAEWGTVAMQLNLQEYAQGYSIGARALERWFSSLMSIDLQQFLGTRQQAMSPMVPRPDKTPSHNMNLW